MTEQAKGDTPLYDELMAARMPAAAERIVDLPPPASALGSQALQEAQAVREPRHAEKKPAKEKVFLSTDSYPSAKPFIDAINNAILDGERAIMGRLFLDYINDNRPYIASHEFTKLQQEVRAL